MSACGLHAVWRHGECKGEHHAHMRCCIVYALPYNESIKRLSCVRQFCVLHIEGYELQHGDKPYRHG